jgi:hypothetical protein
MHRLFRAAGAPEAHVPGRDRDRRATAKAFGNSNELKAAMKDAGETSAGIDWIVGVVAQRRGRAFRFAYRLISGVTEMPWSTTDAATVVSVNAINSFANGSGKP